MRRSIGFSLPAMQRRGFVAAFTMLLMLFGPV